MSGAFDKKPYTLMGVVNVTPDSFSDGGQFLNSDDAIAHGLRLLAEGADILDIGGESTRPGAKPVSCDEEIRRIVPVIEGLKGKARWISIDTRHASVMEAALRAGANFINDVTALEGDPDSLRIAASAHVPVCLMHMQGTPQSMQENPAYTNVVEQVFKYLDERVKLCVKAGMDKSHIIVDPGIGFGKTLEHNLLLLRNIERFLDLNVPVLLGASRKSFISGICGDIQADERMPGSIAAVLHAYAKGIKLFRVHDVAQTRQALDVFKAIEGSVRTASPI